MSGKVAAMPTDQYHEPPDELSPEVRTFARVVASLQEEAEAIGWYEQRISVEPNEQARAIMENAQQEEAALTVARPCDRLLEDWIRKRRRAGTRATL